MASVTISLCMIVKNEEEVLGRCLSSVTDFVDEIIIVDTGSSDRTKEIAKQYTDKIYDFEWVDDFSKARNFSFSKATKDYIMWLDADDIVPEESRLQILELKNNQIGNHKMNCIFMEYQYSFDSEGILISTHRRERMVKRKCNFKWIGLVHERLEVSGDAFITNINIKHMKNKPHSSNYIKIYEKAMKQGKKLTAKDKLHFANECFEYKQYKKAMELYEAVLNSNTVIKNEQIYVYLKIADCHIQFNDLDQAITSCLDSFKLDSPKGEVCCRLGYIYLLKNQIPMAIDWYKISSNLDVSGESTYTQQPCYTWLPHTQLCACYALLGEFEEAKKHNDIAAKYIPNSSYVNTNKRLLEEMKSIENI
ncbi:tetratricopeptide repeat-containing glycosyltransferase family 2 protein [Chengkuizengella marina]|uniref:Glycosyltransferase family 2 protein n=1 Tax=Chengkuizengella marina TaxID=2507566 RepID=A0A6N9Q3H6_9BACL|nr:glycosyltransferase family 2 protein [Chengkuizengella marina]NBI29358.1 glycosyltransferase family 2 protein [Chengkuizengella marina]